MAYSLTEFEKIGKCDLPEPAWPQIVIICCVTVAVFGVAKLLSSVSNSVFLPTTKLSRVCGGVAPQSSSNCFMIDYRNCCSDNGDAIDQKLRRVWPRRAAPIICP